MVLIAVVVIAVLLVVEYNAAVRITCHLEDLTENWLTTFQQQSFAYSICIHILHVHTV